DGMTERFAVGGRMALDEGEAREQHTRRAKPALYGAVPEERLLQRVQPAVVLQSTYGGDRAMCGGRRPHETARHGPAVEQDGAGAAHALATAVLDVEDPQRVTEHVEQRLARLDVEGTRATIDVQADAHDQRTSSARAAARVSARRASTPTSRRRYSADTNASDSGATVARAASAARAIRSEVGSLPTRSSSAAATRTGVGPTPPKASRASS